MEEEKWLRKWKSGRGVLRERKRKNSALWLTAIVSRKWSSLSLLLSTPPMLNSVGLLSFPVVGLCMTANLMCRKMTKCNKIFANAMLLLILTLVSVFLLPHWWYLFTVFSPSTQIKNEKKTHTHRERKDTRKWLFTCFHTHAVNLRLTFVNIL